MKALVQSSSNLQNPFSVQILSAVAVAFFFSFYSLENVFLVLSLAYSETSGCLVIIIPILLMSQLYFDPVNEERIISLYFDF